jgi:hypothetical protein
LLIFKKLTNLEIHYFLFLRNILDNFHTAKKFVFLGLGVLSVMFFFDSGPNFFKDINKSRLELDKSISENIHPVYGPLIFWMVLIIGVAIYIVHDLKRKK